MRLSEGLRKGLLLIDYTIQNQLVDRRSSIVGKTEEGEFITKEEVGACAIGCLMFEAGLLKRDGNKKIFFFPTIEETAVLKSTFPNIQDKVTPIELGVADIQGIGLLTEKHSLFWYIMFLNDIVGMPVPEIADRLEAYGY